MVCSFRLLGVSSSLFASSSFAMRSPMIVGLVPVPLKIPLSRTEPGPENGGGARVGPPKLLGSVGRPPWLGPGGGGGTFGRSFRGSFAVCRPLSRTRGGEGGRLFIEYTLAKPTPFLGPLAGGIVMAGALAKPGGFPTTSLTGSRRQCFSNTQQLLKGKECCGIDLSLTGRSPSTHSTGVLH